MKFLLTIFLLPLLYSCKTNIKSQDSEQLFIVSDSILLKRYEYQIIGDYLEEEIDSLSKEEINEMHWKNRVGIAGRKVAYAPDNSFKIFVLELHSCGAYCNPLYYSWIHYNLKGKEVIKEAEFEEIDTIHKLPDNKYLIIDYSWARPAGVLTVGCMGAKVISFPSDSLIVHSFEYPEKYSYNNIFFGFCQEHVVEEDFYIEYDKNKETLNYKYGNNYSYSQGIDTDTIRTGYFKYKDGVFILEEETIKVINREN